MKSFLAVFLICGVAHAQYKTGIKTHYPTSASHNATGSLIQGNATEQHYYGGGGGGDNNYSGGNSYTGGSSYSGSNSHSGGSEYSATYDRTFVPADTYQGSTLYAAEGQNYYGSNLVAPPAPVTRRPVILDATAQFINATRATMASGVCHKEVPTASLVSDPSLVASGNGTTPNMSKIQVCCDGYERNQHVFKRCDPICADDCPNGICTEPNVCVCIPGHVRNEKGKCISICPLGCGNGVCDEQGECQCKPGYKLEPTERKYCIPHCDQDCKYGACVAPNKCDCTEGYRLTAAGVCEPVCKVCDNGHCIAPGICSCDQGYRKIDSICEPICTRGCNKGRCIAPETCECPHGFSWSHKDAACVPHCDQPCLNGVCDGPNTCACNTGFIQDDNQRNICKPNCPQGCPNGYCSAPNFCICRPGFIKSGVKGRQTCIAA